jgi:hypothetical protein
MTGAELRQLMETFLPDMLLGEGALATGFSPAGPQARRSEVPAHDADGGVHPGGGPPARHCGTTSRMGAERVVRGSFYDWFGPPLEQSMVMFERIALA